MPTPGEPAYGVCQAGFKAHPQYHSGVAGYICDDLGAGATECKLPVAEAQAACVARADCCVVVQKEGANTARLGGCSGSLMVLGSGAVYGTCEKLLGLAGGCRDGYSAHDALFGSFSGRPCEGVQERDTLRAASRRCLRPVQHVGLLRADPGTGPRA